MGVKDRKYTLIIRNAADSSTLCTLSGSELISGNVVDEINGEQTLTFVMDQTASDFTHIAARNMVRLNDTEGPTYVTYRIKDIKEYREGLKLKAQVYCEHLKYDLAETVVKTKKSFVQQKPSNILTEILGYASGFSNGTVTPTVSIDFEVGYESCLEAIQRLADVTGYDYEVIADGGGSHKDVNIITIDNTSNGTPGTATIEFKKNLKSISKNVKTSEDFATRIVAVGGESEPQQNYNYKDNIDPLVLTVQYAMFVMDSYDNGTGWINVNSDKLLSQDDSLNGYYVYSVYNGAAAVIVDSDKQSGYDRVQVASGLSWTSGEQIYFLDTDGTTALNFVPDDVVETTHGTIEKPFIDESIGELYNVAGPEDKSDLSGTYTAGLCEGWTKIGTPTVSENSSSTYIVNGTKSQRVQAADTEGIYRGIVGYSGVAFSFYIWIYINSIAASSQLVIRQSIGGGNYFPTNPDTNADECVLDDSSSGWYQVIVEGGEFATNATHNLQIFADGGAIDFYLDSVVVVFSEYMPIEDVFIPHSSRKLLWERAVEVLRNINSPKTYYDIGFLDLFEHDSTTYASDEFLPGDDITLQDQTDASDTGLGINATVRCTKKSWDLLKPWQAKANFETT